MKLVRFKGKFTDLIPNGWTFQKLFARNYRQYHKTCDGQKYSQGCRIWQHHGGYLEIGDLDSELSAVFVEQIIAGKINEWGSVIGKLGSPTKTEIVYWFIIDQKENRFIPRGSTEDKQLRTDFHNWFSSDASTLENKEKIDAYYDRYREWNADPDLIVMLQDLVDKQWIIVEDAEI